MSTVELLRAHAPAAPDSLHARVLALRPEQKRRSMRPLLVIAAAAVLAVVAAVVHGFTTSSPAPRLQPHTSTLTLRGNPGAGGTVTTPTWGVAAPPLPAKSSPALDAGVKQHAIVVPTSSNRLQHTDASIRIRVSDLGDATTRATRVATSLGGYAQSVLERSPQSFIELRVPAQNVKRALSELAGLGTIVSQQLSVQDLTSVLQRQSEEIAQLRRRIAALNAALRNPSLPESQRVLLQIKLAESKRALAQRLNGRKGTITAGTTARISLVLTTQKHAAIVHHRGRLGRMFHSAVGFLAIEAMVALFALIVVSPFAIALGLLWFWRRRAVERLLME